MRQIDSMVVLNLKAWFWEFYGKRIIQFQYFAGKIPKSRKGKLSEIRKGKNFKKTERKEGNRKKKGIK